MTARTNKVFGSLEAINSAVTSGMAPGEEKVGVRSTNVAISNLVTSKNSLSQLGGLDVEEALALSSDLSVAPKFQLPTTLLDDFSNLDDSSEYDKMATVVPHTHTHTRSSHYHMAD